MDSHGNPKSRAEVTKPLLAMLKDFSKKHPTDVATAAVRHLPIAANPNIRDLFSLKNAVNLRAKRVKNTLMDTIQMIEARSADPSPRTHCPRTPQRAERAALFGFESDRGAAAALRESPFH